MKTTFLRILEELEDKEAGLKRSIERSESTRDTLWFEVDVRDFSMIPGSPFAYWVRERLRLLYSTQQSLEASGRVARRGINSNDDERFLRLTWECNSEPWALYAKGGVWSPYYADPHMNVKWGKSGEELIGRTRYLPHLQNGHRTQRRTVLSAWFDLVSENKEGAFNAGASR